MDPNANATLLKYRFGELGHMQNHLHVVEGRTLFFYRDPRTSVEAGARVVVEFSFAINDQVSTLRGAVLARSAAEGGQSGLWIEFPDTRLVRKIDAGASSLSARRQRRMGCDLMVELSFSRRPFIGRMVDVSLGGVRIVGPVGLRPGAEVEMRIVGAQPPMPAMLGRAEAVRSEAGGEVGVRFIRSDAVARVASSKLYAAVQLAWAKAVEVAHSPLCCKDGNKLEPPLPHMKLRM